MHIEQQAENDPIRQWIQNVKTAVYLPLCKGNFSSYCDIIFSINLFFCDL